MENYLDNSLRLEALRELKILDTPNEKVFDDLVSLAAQICDSPISLISLVDESRQWFKAKYGITTNETPRQHAFCAHAILSENIFQIDDSLLDARFKNNPLVTHAPFIRFYAGIPLTLGNGHRIGTLCVIDMKPKKLSEFQTKALTTLGHQATALIEGRHKDSLRLAAMETIENQKLMIMHSSKMSALGEMAAGVAHEINNPLAAIMAFAGDLRYRSQIQSLSNKDIELHSDKVEKTCLRIAKIVKGLRSFSRDGEKDNSETVWLGQIIEDALDLCREKLQQNSIDLQFSMPPKDLMVHCKTVQITQVLLNLLNNAFDAVEKLPQKWVRLEYTTSPRGIEISVTDSGHGIPLEARENLMKPFFTTKPVGKGTGLGLSISHRIMQAHHGDLSLDNSCQNTRFVLLLPVTPAQKAS